jgi:hypothetical protein
LYSTHLSGTILQELSNLTSLERLDLSATQIEGTIPPSFGNFSKLTLLSLWGTRLSGTLPSTLDDLNSLDFLWLHNVPSLSGTLPTGMCAATLDFHSCMLGSNGSAALGGCNKLRTLDLSDNSLTALPTNLPQNITHLYLGSNPIKATANRLGGVLRTLPRLAALDVAVLGLEVALSLTRVTAPAGCRLGPGAPRCAFELQLYDRQGQAVKVGGLKPGLALKVRGLQVKTEDLGDGRYNGTVPSAWAPNATGTYLTVGFFDGEQEFNPNYDGGGTLAEDYDDNYASLRTVKYGEADCPAGSHTIPDPATGAACVCRDGYAPDGAAGNTSAAGCHTVSVRGSGFAHVPSRVEWFCYRFSPVSEEQGK